MKDILESSKYTRNIGYIITEAAPEEPTKTEIVDATPGISTTTVQRTLTDLVKAEKIIKIGNGRYTKYKWNWDKEH